MLKLQRGLWTLARIAIVQVQSLSDETAVAIFLSARLIENGVEGMRD